jgi:hypothetical protein
MVAIHRIFPTPLLQFKFNKHQNYDWQETEKRYRIPDGWDQPLNSSFPEILDDDAYVSPNVRDSLKLDMMESITDALTELKLPNTVEYLNFWYNIYHEEQGQEIHWHLPQAGYVIPYWSGIYFAKNCNPTIFHRDHGVHRTQKFPGYEDSEIADCSFINYWPNIEDGDILLFPPWLMHTAHTEQKDKMRLTFSFNLVPKYLT